MQAVEGEEDLMSGLRGFHGWASLIAMGEVSMTGRRWCQRVELMWVSEVVGTSE